MPLQFYTLELKAIYFKPVLTTIQQDFFNFGKIGVKKLYDIVSKNCPQSGQKVYLKPELIVRKTSLKKSLNNYQDVMIKEEIKQLEAKDE